jgi:L-arabinose isomerase
MKNNINNTPALKIGLFGIGLQAYWEQFEGLEERLKGYVDLVSTRLQSFGPEIINLGLIDTPEKAFEAGTRFRREDVDLIFLYVTTYALSSTVLPVIKKAKVPVVILNLSPGAAIDYATFNLLKDRTVMTGEWLAYCSACPVPEIASVFKRCDISFQQVTGMLDNDPVAWREIEEWVVAARVAHLMSTNRLGLIGNYYNGMLDIYTNLTLQCATFGGHIEIIEADELSGLKQQVTHEALNEKISIFHETFDIQDDCSAYELKRAAFTAVALDLLVQKHKLGSIAYYHKGTDNPS